MQELLSRDEEFELGDKIQKMLRLEEKGVTLEDPSVSIEDKRILEEGARAVDTMIKANVGLVHDRVKNFKSHYNNDVDYDDLFQDGMIGLLTAIHKFDPARGNKFSTVAFPWIFQALNRSTNNYSRLVRLPENRIIEYGKILEITNRYTNEDITQVELDEIIKDELKITDRVLNDIRSTMSPTTSLNRPISNDESSPRELIDFIETEVNDDSLEDQVVKTELMSIVRESLSNLDEIEKVIVTSSFALDLIPEKFMTPNEVREKYNLSRSRFNNILNKALVKVKKDLEKMGLSLNDFI